MPPWGMMKIKLPFCGTALATGLLPRGVHGMGPWHLPSSHQMGHTSQQTLHLQREGRLASLDGKVGASVKEVQHSIP